MAKDRKSRRKERVAGYKAELRALLRGMQQMHHEIELTRIESARIKEETAVLKAETRAKLRDLGCSI